MNRSERGTAAQQQANSVPNGTSSTTTNTSNNGAANSSCGAAPYRSLRNNYKRFHHHHHHHRRHRNQWWRNPCIIFFISFAALGTLRFRVPARSRKAASQLILKQREKRAAKKQQNRESLLGISPDVTARTAAADDSSINTAEELKNSMIISKNTTASVSYTLLEEGKNGSHRSFQKYRVLLKNDQQPVSVQIWAELLSHTTSDKDPVLAGLLRIIRSAPYKAIFFETPPVTSATFQQQPMEFVLMDAPRLHTAASEHPDPHAFAQQFLQQNSNTNAVAFENLGGDARLIAPKPPPPAVEKNDKLLRRYAHLSSFCREAPAEEVVAVWRLAAQEYLQRIQQQVQPVWFSTSGLGIYWLHFRLDSVPKYYTYLPYKQQQP